VSIDSRVKALTPLINSRLRPKRSASVPAAISRLPKLSRKALVIQLRASADPPGYWAIAGVAITPAEKLSGNIRAALQTAKTLQRLPGAVRIRELIVDSPLSTGKKAG